MTFLELMSVVAGISGLCGAVRASTGAGPGPLALGAFAGLIVGSMAFWIPHRVGGHMIERYGLHKAERGLKLVASWLFAAFLFGWIILAIFAGETLAALLNHR